MINDEIPTRRKFDNNVAYADSFFESDSLISTFPSVDSNDVEFGGGEFGGGGSSGIGYLNCKW